MAPSETQAERRERQRRENNAVPPLPSPPIEVPPTLFDPQVYTDVQASTFSSQPFGASISVAAPTFAQDPTEPNFGFGVATNAAPATTAATAQNNTAAGFPGDDDDPTAGDKATSPPETMEEAVANAKAAKGFDLVANAATGMMGGWGGKHIGGILGSALGGNQVDLEAARGRAFGVDRARDMGLTGWEPDFNTALGEVDIFGGKSVGDKAKGMFSEVIDALGGSKVMDALDGLFSSPSVKGGGSSSSGGTSSAGKGKDGSAQNSDTDQPGFGN